MIDWLGVCNVVGGCFYWRNFMNCFFWIVLGMVLLLMVCNVFVFNEVFEGVVVVEGEEYGEYEEVLLEIKIVVKVVQVVGIQVVLVGFGEIVGEYEV